MRVDVPPEAAGERLDAFLGTRIGSRSQAQRLLEEGLVTVDGEQLAKRHRLSGGERIDVGVLPIGDGGEGEPAPYEVVYEDARLMVVDKPAGVVVHPGRGNRTGTLSQALAARGAAGGDPWRAGIVHRLDKDTSGLLVVAKDEEAHRRLKRLLSERLIEREYLALVDGRPPSRSGTVDAPIGRDRRLPTRMSTDTDTPREARTHFALERALPTSTLLRVRLETGRTHQIRVHLEAIGFPVCGDPIYGRAGAFGLKRQFLHAARLALPDPFGGAPIEALSPLPPDLVLALEEAEKCGPDHRR
jgi:23S rRNA pseudouridine1911/1915/1917 synthase